MGRANTQERRAARLAMTPDILWLLKQKLAKAKMPVVKKRLLWATATFLFVGSLRSGEVLPSNKELFVRDATLLNKNVSLETRKIEKEEVTMLKIRLESPKEDRKRQGVTVELFRLQNSFFCPVTAWMKWKEVSRLDNHPNLPLFRHEDGSGLTQKELNTTLKLLLQNEIDYSNGRISSHSFRAGLTTAMGRLGYGEEIISLQGRWRSEAYLKYCKEGRANRLKDQWQLMKEMTEVSKSWISGGILV